MSVKKSYVSPEGTLELFTKKCTTKSGILTYSDAVKKSIVIQYCKLRRNPLCNQTRALEILAEAHQLSSTTIKNWYDLYGDEISTPGIPKPKDKPRKKPTKTKVEETSEDSKIETEDLAANFDVLSSVVNVINKTSDSSLSKVLDIIKSLPEIDIKISIKPSKFLK